MFHVHVYAGELTWSEFVALSVIQHMGNTHDMAEARNRVLRAIRHRDIDTQTYTHTAKRHTQRHTHRHTQKHTHTDRERDTEREVEIERLILTINPTY
jgi:hypothetical protein